MSTFQERLDNAAGGATCQILSAGGSALVGAGAWSLATGGPGVAALTVGSLALLASNYACTWDPEGESSLQPGFSNIAPGQCLEADQCQLWLTDVHNTQWNGSKVRKLNYIVDDGFYPNGTPRVKYSYINCDFEEIIATGSGNDMPITTEVKNGANCVGDPSPEPPIEYPPYDYVEPDGPNGEPGCSLTVNVLGWGVNNDGTSAPIFKIEPKQELKAGGGIIGGCNFEPVVYYQPKPPGNGPGGGGGDGDPPYTIPFVDGGDEGDPEWLRLLKNALAGAAGNLVASAIKELLEQPYEGVDYSMPAPCDVDENAIPLLWTGQIPEQKFEPAVLDRLDAISSQITQHLQWKTPICAPEPIELEGDFRTISFRSDETSPYGKSRLRKRLRYRSVSGIGLGELVDYWKDFTFEAGPVVVGHIGGPWGTPQVWASSEDEAKRVLRHAAGEAGFDPDQVGQWRVGSSDSARYGVSGTMRVDTTGGYYWITARDGSDNRPIVATSSEL